MNTPCFLVLTPEYGHMPIPGCKVSSKWYTVSERSTILYQWPCTSARGPSVNTDFGGGGNGGLDKLLGDANPNFDTLTFQVLL